MAITKEEILACTNRTQLAALNSNKNCTGTMTGSRDCNGSADCTDCANVDNSERCVRCHDLGQCFDCADCRGQTGDKSLKLDTCTGLTECNRCVYTTSAMLNTRDLQQSRKNIVWGVQMTPSEFQTIWTTVLGRAW